ncbi:uncharacterized protein LOC129568800 [Sitodiplosis mosellana]|uniref:uncharacterized protein LOC129568800 n=1 Tax=Sitodiplosis mosellana TaxID=263140 RepID=UPI00244375B0|nr:uncharacterized protein LOC129568800 [Sitodiplosis mosellana]
MKRKLSEHVDHTYGLRSMAKRSKPTIQLNAKVADRQIARGRKSDFPLKYAVVVLHDIGKEVARLTQQSQCAAPATSITPTTPITTPYSHFMELNDHCILEVMDFLTITELCAMAEVSVRLKKLSEYFFRVKFGRFFSMEHLLNGTDKIGIKQARRLFQNFGHLITSLHVSRKWFVFDLPYRNAFKGQRQLLTLINEYCSKNLKTLTLRHFWINPELIMEHLPVFMRLQTLNYYRLSCYCSEEKTFAHFGNIVSKIFEFNQLTHQMPQLVQLV